ncbi:hypothetical protein CC1G_01081 [Coprinopsis cinerea okayama7|uniref:DUF1776-domain-containing protein n=1 Tax=Coprinopsis cinerea (strain Okayama-7 / 130 / ATCC MYA-4618 / FGSC 9003) TaxID=240176 RepID=A8NEG4_COPC7|nr:hypothetical protein CC1G_01081 [Coprinopsis cinerea okayama7\|eukprot:XP_001833019.1 hypothetical protein CC1G_01081 [Coprinopsis cinerea okayama7\
MSSYDKLEASLDKIDDYLQSLEEYFFSSVSAVSHGLPDVHEVVNRLWVDISRYGPGLPSFPDVGLPTPGDFQIPPPPPPPQPALPVSMFNSSVHWIKTHPKTVSAVAVGIVGTGLYTTHRKMSAMKAKQPASKLQAQSAERKQVVVVLGGDTPHGLPLILGLEKKGYIVIASVSTAEAVEKLESRTKGYVKALVLDPQEPATVPIFLRSLSSTLSRRFPLRAAGDPHSSPSSQPYVQSVISLLTLPSSASPALGPLEHLSLAKDYLPYLTATQITPLQVIQQLLPILRTGSARARDKGHKTIVVCLPAVDTRVSLPFSSVQAMSAAGTLKAVETLRREIQMAAVTGKAESMSSIKVVIVDVGAVDVGRKAPATIQDSLLKATESWTSSEKVIYGPAFASVLQEQPPASLWDSLKSLFDEDRRYTVSRRPVRASTFVEKIIAVVSGGRTQGPFICGHDVGIGYVRTWLQGDRFAVGAGALTYRLASYLPSLLLDTLLNLPYLLIGLRNRLLPTQPFRRPPRDIPAASRRRTSPTQQRRDRGGVRAIEASKEELPLATPPEVEEESDEAEIDIGTPPSESESVDSSWISLQSLKSDDPSVDTPTV